MSKVIQMESNLYDIITENPSKGEVLFAIGLKEGEIARFRDVDVPPYRRFRQIPLFTDSRFKDENTTKDTVVVLTRTGGGNRAEYKTWWENIKKHHNYVIDYDADFDRTYAFIEFKCDKHILDNLKKLDNSPNLDKNRIIEKNKSIVKMMAKAMNIEIDEKVLENHAIQLANDLLYKK